MTFQKTNSSNIQAYQYERRGPKNRGDLLEAPQVL